MNTNRTLPFMLFIKQDYDAFTMSIVFLLVLLVVLVLNSPYLIIGFASFVIIPIIVVASKYFIIREFINKGITITGKIENLFVPELRHSRRAIDNINEKSGKGLIVIKARYNYEGKEYAKEYRFRHLEFTQALKVGEEIDLLVTPGKPTKFILKNIWVKEHLLV